MEAPKREYSTSKFYPESQSLEKKRAKKRAIYLYAKRTLDFVLSFLVSFILIIPLFMLAFIIVCKDFGNPFFVQTRVGLNGKQFKMVKLRSMKVGSDQLERILNKEQIYEYRNEYKLDDDPRLIGWKKSGDGNRCFGAILRRTSLDELPQILINICLLGNMSIVGPRPILAEELEEHYTPEEQQLLLSVKPGLTGYWQAYARNDASYKTGKRQQMELKYAQNAKFLWDIQIIFATFGAVLRERGAK
ncbi:MAG: sugar transferase [Clostridia bacterium]|nr:sugar transferase [Clostridia bacterium]